MATTHQTPDDDDINATVLPNNPLRQDLGLIDEQDLAAAFGVKSFTVAGWRRNGDGPDFVQIGKRIFYRRADVVDWVKAKVEIQTRRAKRA
jgi:hypothetical protein